MNVKQSKGKLSNLTEEILGKDPKAIKSHLESLKAQRNTPDYIVDKSYQAAIESDIKQVEQLLKKTPSLN